MISILVVVYVYHNVGLSSRNVTAGVIILEHPMSGVVLKLFRLAKVKSVKTGRSVCWGNETGDWTQ